MSTLTRSYHGVDDTRYLNSSLGKSSSSAPTINHAKTLLWVVSCANAWQSARRLEEKFHRLSADTWDGQVVDDVYDESWIWMRSGFCLHFSLTYFRWVGFLDGIQNKKHTELNFYRGLFLFLVGDFIFYSIVDSTSSATLTATKSLFRFDQVFMAPHRSVLDVSARWNEDWI